MVRFEIRPGRNRLCLRAKFLGRFRLFFRYDGRAQLIVYAGVNDDRSLRRQGGRNDPYELFRRMSKSGNPPNDWAALLKAVGTLPADIGGALAKPRAR